MYEDYKKLRTTLEDIHEGGKIDRTAVKKVLDNTIDADTPDELYRYAFLDCEHHSAQIAVILSLMGVSAPRPPTWTKQKIFSSKYKPRRNYEI